MLTSDELKFIEYWKSRREMESRWYYQLLTGLPVGLLFGLPIFLILFSSRYWYKRADMQAISSLNPLILIIAVAAIACFTAIFHKRTLWDRKEQQYKEFLSRKNP
ncbi:MAG TPA: hypothetical protein VM012_03160 [Flavitalea sp.]|nr:hypothetical protein [Flavitalea sp.]